MDVEGKVGFSNTKAMEVDVRRAVASSRNLIVTHRCMITSTLAWERSRFFSMVLHLQPKRCSSGVASCQRCTSTGEEFSQGEGGITAIPSASAKRGRWYRSPTNV